MSATSNYAIVVTTIQNPTKALLSLVSIARSKNEKVFIIGDKKTPLDFELDESNYYSTEKQNKLNYKIIQKLPWNSYTRKMLGYLEAAASGTKYIRETDDDNFPLESFFESFPNQIEARDPRVDSDWINPYIYFSDQFIWPRGYPIELIQSSQQNRKKTASNVSQKKVNKIGVVQGLANGSPDVDALFRLVMNNVDDFEFKVETPIVVPNFKFAPFNSQVTTWDIELLLLMYLPQTCTFRMTDIWRSFIATHLMHLNGYSLVFTCASAFQHRNEHDLLKDFSDEIPGYMGNVNFVKTIQKLKLKSGMENLPKNIIIIYEELIASGFFKSEEMDSLNAWIQDCEKIAHVD